MLRAGVSARAAGLAGATPTCAPHAVRSVRCSAQRRCAEAAAEEQQRQRAAPLPGLPVWAVASALGGLAIAPAAALAAPQAVADLALDSAGAAALSGLLRPLLSLGEVMMVVRIVLTWYPEVDEKALPWSLVVLPTEPVLSMTRKVVKPFNGLDVSPIVWVALLSFISEILTGPQGILSLMERKGV